MVKLYALSILYKSSTSVTLLKAAYDLQSFGFFQRSSVQEFMQFFCKTIVERTQIATRQSVNEQDYTCHVYVRSDGLAGVAISDHEYPHRVSHTLLTKVLNEFAAQVPSDSWANASENTMHFPQVNVYLAKYQNPREADAITRIQEELDETNIIMHNTLEAVLQRGEKIDDLISKSESLSVQSKTFYKTARKTDSCCTFS